MRRTLLAVCLALLALCAACVPDGSGEGPGGGEAAVWFLANGNGETGAALAPEYRPVPEGAGEEKLLEMLLAGPESLELSSPFPRGTALKSLRLEGDLALVDLSEAYGGLSGADLSLADGCIVLTLSQFSQVKRVYLTVEGRPRPFRDQVLSAQDFLLENGAGGASQMEARLWFPGEEDIAPEERTLELRMGDCPEIAVLQALLAGPESGELQPLCPEGTALLSLTVEEERYVVDVSGSWLEGEEDPRRIQAIAATLAEWEPEARVELLVEGQPAER